MGATITQSDLEFLRQLGFNEQGPEPSSWRFLLRGRNILLVMPNRGREAIRIGCNLYRPQRSLAKIFMAIVSGSFVGRLVLPKWSASIDRESALGTILKTGQLELNCILLGNPSQEERRAILLAKSENGELSIVKLGTSQSAVDKIEKEKIFLQENAEKFQEIPNLLGIWDENSWSAFSVCYCEGEGTPSELEIYRILESWASSELVMLGEVPDWGSMLKAILKDEELRWIEGRSKKIQLRPTMRHGDFAPWNLLTAANGETVVIDWESAELNSVPGWDLVHYFYRKATLIEKKSDETALYEICMKFESDLALKELMEFWGWGSESSLLIKSYFYSMAGEIEGGVFLAENVTLN